MMQDGRTDAASVREAYITFFEGKEHQRFPSSSVVPFNDPTLLFINSGMCQYKGNFMGTTEPGTPYHGLKRVCNSQKCLRAGGKHNDLEDVGKDVYHHTFFEMLGNWSFGDYFKEEAISWAWELLTERFGLAPDRLYATYFEGDEALGLPADEEARSLWLRYLPESSVLPGNTKDNFWEMGATGPCGPCSELHYDRIGGRDAASLVNMDDPDVLEIWNLVFMQFNREESGALTPLPDKHVDTGMGFERIVSVLQDKPSNYDTELFTPLFAKVQELTGAPAYQGRVGDADADNVDMAYRVIADHIRTLCVSIADGCLPGAMGRNYVLKRVLRRACRYGKEVLGGEVGFFSKLVPVVVDMLGGPFPELVAKQEEVTRVILSEELAFDKSLTRGIREFTKIVRKLKKKNLTQLSAQQVWKLWGTFGFPSDLTQLMAEERGMTIDRAGFDDLMANPPKTEAKKDDVPIKLDAVVIGELDALSTPATDDEPKFSATSDPFDCKVVALVSVANKVVPSAATDDVVGVLLDRTPFYAEGGGQVYDKGELVTADGSLRLHVSHVHSYGSYILHVGTVEEGQVATGDAVQAVVDMDRREPTAANHSATHVLNYALRKVVGDHVDQKGSLVNARKLRFDFNNPSGLKLPQLEAVQKLVQDQVDQDAPLYTKVVPLADAMSIHGLRAVFGESYPDPVRVVSVGRSVDDLLANPKAEDNMDYSVELCGGTHVPNMGVAQQILLLSESAISQGVRRIIAVTGFEALQALETADAVAQRLEEADALPKTKLPDEVVALDKLINGGTTPLPAVRKPAFREALAKLRSKLVGSRKETLAAMEVVAEAEVARLKALEALPAFLVLVLDAGDIRAGVLAVQKTLRAEVPELPVLLLSEGVKGLIVVAHAPTGGPIHAGNWAKTTALAVNGKGGGRAESGNGSSKSTGCIEDANAAATEFATSATQ